MKEYFLQVKLYTIYFFKISISNKMTFFYSLVLPGLLLQFQILSQLQDIEAVSIIFVSWMGYMIINHALIHTFALSLLREDGYLKQYHTIVKSPSIFVIGRTLVGFIHLIWSSLILVFLVTLTTELSFAYLALLSLSVILLTYPPFVMLCSFFLIFRVKSETVITIRNVAANAFMFLTFISQVNLSDGINTFIDAISPIALTMNTFFLIAEMDIMGFVITILPTLLIYLLIGTFSLKHMEILPLEGVL